MAIEAFAPAKINLTLHVTGQRADGYHLLDSLVMLADVGDTVKVKKAAQTKLSVVGPMAKGVPVDQSNLVVKAANLLGLTAEITLHKTLPAMAGIGGGSSDAAATVRALCKLYNRPEPSVSELLRLGSDVPVCMQPCFVRMRGIGDQIDRLGSSESWPMILVNPGVSVSTPEVFSALSSRENPAMDEPSLDWMDWASSVSWLSSQRNDMQDAAVKLQPVIGTVLAALSESVGCKLARMSGSGATCFAIFFDDALRNRALEDLRRKFPSWWIASTEDVGIKWHMKKCQSP
ncbi:4-(cytidine 5'-diphospho)-2-C-methyl-D-erythritol kinase [Shimia sp. NS0008-38b]|uniref:4-(cytidine 5'-diphospho)-2-C-methyl-D-erythritol kinase n=1 Tax=Shimia sp. NS0008-38b TaxID=3127653 RepID=UPI003107B0D3